MGDGASGPDVLNYTKIFVALDDGERCGPLHFRAGVLDGLASVGVLVGAADTRRDHPGEDGSRFEESRERVVPDLDLTGRHQRRGLNRWSCLVLLAHVGETRTIANLAT